MLYVLCAPLTPSPPLSLSHHPRTHTPIDLPLPSELEVVVPKGPHGRLMFTAADYNGRLVVLEFSTHRRGPLQACGRVKVGDVLTAINGYYITHLPYPQVVKLLASVSTPYVYLRFLRTREQAGEAGAKER